MPDDRVKQRKPRLRYVEPEDAAELAGRHEAKRLLSGLGPDLMPVNRKS